MSSDVQKAVDDGLYYAIPIYFCILGMVAIFSYRRLHTMVMNKSTDEVTGHFLAGRSFGPLITAGTVFASLFSGYTVVGIPNESFMSGFMWAFRWMPSFAVTALACMCTGVRLRKASVVRNHQTPVDFLTDRFRSQTLRYSILVIQVMASIVYLAAQVTAIRSTFNAMFGIPEDKVGPTLAIIAIIVGLEWAGGLAVVAMSDSLQGFIMILSFIIIPSVIKKNFGGWTELDPIMYPRPEFYQTQSAQEQWSFWQFSMINLSFFALPHLIMRVYAAKDLKSLKVGFYAMTIGPWTTMFVGVFIGTVGVQMLWDTGLYDTQDDLKNVSSPYTAILEQVIALGGFARGAGIIALTSSLAAIMSTADSLIIAISQLITVECAWPLLGKESKSSNTISWIGKFTSLASAAFATLIGLAWKNGVSALSAINFPIIMQAVPAFIVGLYSPGGEFHPWSLVAGSWVGIMFVFLFYFLYLYDNPAAAGVDAGIVGVILNVMACVLVEIVLRRRSKERPDWDIPSHERFGEHPLTARLLDRMMTGFPEPLRNGWCIIGFFIAVTICTPMVAEGLPGLVDDTPACINDPTCNPYTQDPPVVNGIPWWFFKQILLTVIPYAISMWVLFTMPNVFPFDEKKVDTEGIDPDVLELTVEELNIRDNFDKPNESAAFRRRSVSARMEELGIELEESKEEKPRPPMDKRISSLILVAEKLEENDEVEEINDGEGGVEQALNA